MEADVTTLGRPFLAMAALLWTVALPVPAPAAAREVYVTPDGKVQFRTLPMCGALSTMAPWPQSTHVLNSKSRSCAIPPLFMNVCRQSTWAGLVSDVSAPW